MKPIKVTFFGNFGTQNLGNECTLQAIICRTLERMPDARLQCICPAPEDTVARHNISAFDSEATSPKWLRAFAKVWRRPRNTAGTGQTSAQIGQPDFQTRQITSFAKQLRMLLLRLPKELWHWAKGLAIMRGSRLLIVPGTGHVSDHLTGPFGGPYDIFKWSAIARLCGAKVLFLSIGAGPIYHPLGRWFVKMGLGFAHYRSYRDIASKTCLETLGLPVKDDPVCPDLAFGLPRAMLSSGRTSRSPKPVVGVGLKDYYGPREKGDQPNANAHRDYLGKMAAFVIWLHERGYPVRVLIGDVSFDSSVVRCFMGLLKERGLVPEDGMLVSEPALTVDQLLSQLAATDIVVSPRFHNLVLALMLNKPVIALSDHHKLDSLMVEMDMAEYYVHLRELNPQILIEKFLELERNAQTLRPHILRKAEEYRAALDRQYSPIFAAEAEC